MDDSESVDVPLDSDATEAEVEVVSGENIRSLIELCRHLGVGIDN
jgi:hypothetical protein